jgi:hypothetical protein
MLNFLKHCTGWARLRQLNYSIYKFNVLKYKCGRFRTIAESIHQYIGYILGKGSLHLDNEFLK